VLDCSRRALTLAEALSEPRRLGRTMGSMTNALMLCGDAAGAVAQGERALALVETTDDRALQINTRSPLARALHAVGDYRRAIHLLERNVEAIGGEKTYLNPLGLVLASVLTRAWLAWCLAEIGDFDRAMTVAEEGAGLVLNTAYNRLTVSFGLAVPRLGRGDHAAAIPVLERGLAIAREMNIQNWLPVFAALLGYAHALSGRVTEGLTLLDEALSQAERRIRIGRGLWLSFLSEAYLLAGRPGDAIAVAQRGLEGTRQRHEPGDEARNLRALAEATAQMDPPDFTMADRLCSEALALATELGMRPLVARCHLDLSKLARGTGRQGQAREHLTTATTMLREMDMRFWLERAEAEMKECM
jgi:tetratricopeptide (TPR) repeat protein